MEKTNYRILLRNIIDHNIRIWDGTTHIQGKKWFVLNLRGLTLKLNIYIVM